MKQLIFIILASVLVFFCRLATADAYQDFINDPSQESALSYLHQVTTHPRCSNCHGKILEGIHRPTVGEDGRIHPMNISSTHNLRLKLDGEKFIQIPGSSQPLNCRSCHQDKNGASASMPPGAANDLMPGFIWHMPPSTMIIDEGMTEQQLCENWLDPQKNSFLAIRGGKDDLKTFEKEFLHHVQDDPLIRWAWQPGPGRNAAPGTHVDFVKAMEIWIKHGAKCPNMM